MNQNISDGSNALHAVTAFILASKQNTGGFSVIGQSVPVAFKLADGAKSRSNGVLRFRSVLADIFRRTDRNSVLKRKESKKKERKSPPPKAPMLRVQEHCLL